MATVPVSDERWSEILEQTGLTPRPRRAPQVWASCDRCSGVVPVAEVRWWPAMPPADFQSAFGWSSEDAGLGNLSPPC